MLFTNLETRRSLYFGSGEIILFVALFFLMRCYYLGFLAPYLDRPCLRSCTPCVSSDPRMMWYRTPGKSLTLPPRIRTIECSWRLCPSPGMYAVTSMPLVNRTRATFLSAEFGFLGVVVYTRVHTPRFWGLPCNAGDLLFQRIRSLLFRTTWLIVGTDYELHSWK
jgi:hypothetical protein